MDWPTQQKEQDHNTKFQLVSIKQYVPIKKLATMEIIKKEIETTQNIISRCDSL